MRDLIDVEDLLETLHDPALRLLDCRFDLSDPLAGRKSWMVARIPGAIYADLDKSLAGPVTRTSGRHPLPDRGVFAGWLGDSGIDERSSIVVYDAANSAIAARAWWLLRWIGHEDVRVLDGGFRAWQSADAPVDKGEAVPRQACHYHPGRGTQAVATTDDIVNELEAGSLRLVDARDSRRFSGEVEPLDAVAGHIPGSRNLPFSLLVEEDGRFRSRAELEARWQAALGPAPVSGEWTAMCGSGVTACHLVLAARIIGVGEPRLYAGSWSEWIRDPARPVATGQN